MTRVPKKLVTPPIVETMCELRFSQSAISPHAAVILYSELKNKFPQIETLPHAQLPVELLLSDQNLAYSATHRFSGQGMVAAGPRIVTFTRPGPYHGWDVFRNEAGAVFQQALGVFAIAVERIGIKYTNFIVASPGSDPLALSKAKVLMGDLDMANKPVLVRTEIKRGSQTAIIQLVSPAQIISSDGPRTGLAIEVDSIAFGPFHGYPDIMRALETAHSYEKEVFFTLLADETLAKYQPTY